MSQHQKNIHGYDVFYDDDGEPGIEYLAYIMNSDESQSMFQSAHRSMIKLDFEDRLGRKFILIPKENGDYELKRNSSSEKFLGL